LILEGRKKEKKGRKKRGESPLNQHSSDRANHMQKKKEEEGGGKKEKRGGKGGGKGKGRKWTAVIPQSFWPCSFWF